MIPLDDETQLGDVTPNTVRLQTAATLYDAVKEASEQQAGMPAGALHPERLPVLPLRQDQPGGARRPGGQGGGAGSNCPRWQRFPRSEREIFSVPQGTIVVQDQQIEPAGSRHPGGTAPLLRAPRRPALSGDDLKDPKQQTDPTTNEPNVTFDFTEEGRRAFAQITEEIADPRRRQPRR